MNINFENLEQIPKIFEMMKLMSKQFTDKIEKRWLSTQETAVYLGYSKDSIDSMVQKGELISDIHYFQKARKRMFDKNELDNWVIGIAPINNRLENELDMKIHEIKSSVA